MKLISADKNNIKITVLGPLAVCVTDSYFWENTIYKLTQYSSIPPLFFHVSL